MRAAYVGILSPGSTSRMRAEWLKRLTPDAEWKWIDTDSSFQPSARVWRTLAFRWKWGPAVDRINELVRDSMRAETFDLVWVDKAVFLTEETTRSLRSAGTKLAHFTPDTAFHENKSRHFARCMVMYDLLVTTKSFELDDYRQRAASDSVMLTTQAYDPNIHFPRHGDDERRLETLFVGLAEPDRELCISTLLERGVPVRLGGIGWQRFLREWGRHPNLQFEREEIFGDAYADLLSRSWIGLGLLSKRFPELHTTRTFEIPACGAALATETTNDTTRFFSNDEVLFFSDYGELASGLKRLMQQENIDYVRTIAKAGMKRVQSDGRDYPSVLRSILSHPRLAE